jgi:hypothetical protein
MAMTVTLRDKGDNEVLQQDIGKRPAYPDIIAMGDRLFVIKAVGRDKKTALYGEADKLDIEEGQ